MSILFVHDGPLRKDDEGNYYGLAHNNELFARYKVISDTVGTLIRVREIRREDSKKFTKLSLKNFFVREVPNFSSPKALLFNKIRADKIIKKTVKESDYLIVRLHGIIGLQALKYAKKYQKPYLIELVGCPWDAYWNHSLIGKIFAPYMYKKVKKEVYQSKHTVYVTNDFLQRRYPTQGSSTNCSNVTIDEVSESVLDRRISKIMNRSKEKFIIGTTASVEVKYKGQQYVIEALGNFKKRGYNNFEYQLIGDGDQSYLKEIAKKNNVEKEVKFLGPKVHQDVLTWLDSIDLYAQPSKQEGLPRAVIEAMSRGLPVIGANTAGIPELISNEFVFSNKNNIKEIEELVLKFDDDLLINQAKRNFYEAQNYSISVLNKRREKFYLSFKEENS